MSHTLLLAVAMHAETNPSRLAVITGGKTTSYEQLWQKVGSAAAFLREAGVQREDRVILSAATSTPSFIYGYLATQLLGGIVVPIDPHTPAARLAYIIERVEPKMLLTVRKPENINIPAHAIDIFESLPAEDREEFSYPRSNDAAEILFTSGTTGEPKGVVLTHGNILSAATNINTFIRNNDKDREVVPLPLSHSFGLGRMRCNLLAGGALILTDGLTFPAQIFRSIEEWGATGLASVPSGFAVLFRLSGDRLGKYAEQLRYIEIGSAPMPIEHKKKLMALLPHTRICMHYGLTEASRAAFIEFHESAHKLDSIGRATPNVEIKIVDPEHESELPSDEPGRIMVKGDMVLREYWRNPDLGEEFLHAGWFYTGDYGYRDAEGYLYLQARERDLINVGGRKVSPVEIENTLLMHEAIRECACIGIPDPKGITGEAVKAFLVRRGNSQPKPTAGELTDFLRDHLEPYKIPVEFCWIDAIPTTSSGKVQRMLLKTYAKQDT
jgi:acyl-CoA synthetase (AMP-forming)/AMP-acid ligase II